MSKRMVAMVLAMMLVLAIALVGCSKKLEPKEAALAAATQATTMKSYVLKSQFHLNDISATTSDGQIDAEFAQGAAVLKNAEVTLDGVYQSEPVQTEWTLGIHLKGDMSMDFTIPIIVTKDKIYIKIPKIPFYALPDTMVGKFLELDPAELAKQSGGEFNPGTMDQAKLQKFSNEVMSAVLGEYATSYFANVDVKAAGLPQGVEAKQVVQFKVTNDNLSEAVTTFTDKALPKVLDIMSKDEYKDVLHVKKSELDQAKSDLSAKKGDIAKEVEDAKKFLKVHQFDVSTALNGDNFPVYQSLNANIEFNDPASASKANYKIAMNGSLQYSKINEKQTFSNEIPSGSQVITLDQFQQEISKFRN